MKKYIVIICSCLWIGCTSGYVIDGTSVKKDGKVLLTRMNEDFGIDTLNQTVISQGKFKITGEAKEPICAFLHVDGAGEFIPVFLENLPFTVNIGEDKIDVEGGGNLQLLMREYENTVAVLKLRRDSLKAKYSQYANEDNLFGVMHIRAGMKDLDSVSEATENKFLQENDNLVSAWLIWKRRLELARNKKLTDKYSHLGEKARNTAFGKEIAEYCKTGEGALKGRVAPDFTMDTPEGEPISMHAVKAKVKIIDFWASWCGPCRAENPNVRRLYEKYHDRGLEIIGVSLDSKKEPWVKAIQKDGLKWLHVSDLKGWENAAAKMYGVKGIPHLLVLDSENRIVGEKLYGEELEKCVVEQLNN